MNTGQNNDTKFFCVLLFLFGDLSLSLSPSFPVRGSSVLGGQVGTAWI